MTTKQIKNRLEKIRKEILAERVSYGEIAELIELKEYINEDDNLLRQWAGFEEN